MSNKRLKKLLLSMVLVFTTATLSGCSNKTGDNQQPSETEIKEKTSYELELETLQDFQVVDKTYDNKDLEKYNKMQGYLYRVDVMGKGGLIRETIQLFPPTEEEIAREEAIDNDKITFLNNVIVPCYFTYSDYSSKWLKIYPTTMGETNTMYYQAVDEQYKFTSDEELTKLFGIEETDVNRQFELNK